MAKQVDLKDIDVYYGDFLAVEGVTLTIPSRAVTAFIGPSGCGKSTVLRTINRLHEVLPGARVEGQVLLDGEDIYAPHVDPIWVRRTVGMVFQRPNPFPTMSVRENVVAGLVLREGHQDASYLDQVVEETLRETHLWDEVADRLDAPGAGLSGGQQQRLCVARALAIVFHHVMDGVDAAGWQIVERPDALEVVLVRPATPPVAIREVTSIPRTATGKAPLITRAQ